MEGRAATIREGQQFSAARDVPADGSHPPGPADPPRRKPLGLTLASAPQRSLVALQRAVRAEADLGNGFLLVPVFMAGGALLYFSAPIEPDFPPILMAAGLLWLLAMLNRERPTAFAALMAALMMVTGVLAAKVETWRTDTLVTGSAVTTRITGRVVGIERRASGRMRLTIDLISTERPTLRHAPARVRSTARNIPDGLEAGDVIKGLVRLMPPYGPVRPQSYDFAFKSYFSGIGANGFFMGDPELVTNGEYPAPLALRAQAWLENWRSTIARHIAERIGGPEGEIAAALMTGVRAGIPEEINEALRTVGLYHVISISGLHMALVAGTVMVGLRLAFALAPGFSARRPVKKYAAGAALLATGFYLLVSGSEVAAQRSFLMLAIMLTAVLFDRAALTMRNLAISAIIIILVAPHEVVGPSFQMSFAATAALVASYQAWSNYRERRTRLLESQRSQSLTFGVLRTIVKYAAGLAMTSIVAGAATALFTAWHFQQVAPLGLVANLAAMPIVSLVVMPMAVLAALLMPFGLDGPALDLMGHGIETMNTIAFWLAERSAYDATGTIPLAAVLILTAALAILTLSGGVLRWAAVPFLVAGAVLLAQRQAPDVLVSEDGRLVAMHLSDGIVTVNRDRPNDFTIENWLRAFDAPAFTGPEEGDGEAVYNLTESGFVCGEDFCAARHASGAAIVHAATEAIAGPACQHAAVIVIDDATADNPCRGPDAPFVVTKRDLARRGSVEIIFRTTASGPVPATRFAISEPFRPWHDHRRYSREARGLPPWRETKDD